MDKPRRIRLIEAEARRHRSMAALDAERRLEHLEVARALEWAVGRLGGKEHICRSEINSPSFPRPLR